MDPYYESNTDNNITGEECEDPHCQGCQKPIEDGSVVQFGDGIWHFECFRCAKCQKLVECYSNLLLLRDGSPICEDCSYSCHACLKTIKDEAIMTGDEAYHADCFRCVQCSKKIEDLVFTQTSKGIYCTKCHEARKLLRIKKRDERNNSKIENEKSSLSNTLQRPNPAFRTSSTTSIVNAYTNDIAANTPIIESNDITELNEMLMGQRNSEETISVSTTMNLDEFDDHIKIRELRRELQETKIKLNEVEGKFNKIKTISKRALEEFKMVKEGYAAEVAARKDAEHLNVRLKSEIVFYQQANIFSGHDFIHYSKEEIEDLNATRCDLEEVCHTLRVQKDLLIHELETYSKNIDKLFLTQKPQDLHWERLQHAYQQQLDSMKKDIEASKNNYAKLIKGREDIISDMILLNTKNAELSQLNNDLSRRVMEREQEAKAVFAGMSFLTTTPEGETTTSKANHKRNLSTGSIGINNSTTSSVAAVADITATTTPKLAQRDSFNGSAAPKLFKFRRNKSGSAGKSKPEIISVPYDSNKSLELASDSKKEGKHHFTQTKFIRPIKCEACSEKMWRVSELKCSECNIVCHSKCVYSVSQTCLRSSTSEQMFGNDLIKQIQLEKSKVPLVVEKCIEAVEARGMDYEGIYRKSGGVGQMRQIQQAFEKGEIPNLIDEEKWNDICAVTSVLKQYFRELPNPLFTFELHAKFMDAMMSANSDHLSSITQLIQTLPIENFNTLKYLMEHLNRIQVRNKENLMTSKNLAVIFGPTLLRDQDQNRDLLEMNHKIGIIEFILNHMDTIFVIETLSGSKTNTLTTGADHRRMHLPQFQRGEDLSTLLGNYQLITSNSSNSDDSTPNVDMAAALPAVPPRQNAGYI